MITFYQSIGLEKFLKTIYRVGDTMDDDFRNRQVQRYLRALIDVQLEEKSSTETPIVEAEKPVETESTSETPAAPEAKVPETEEAKVEEVATSDAKVEEAPEVKVEESSEVKVEESSEVKATEETPVVEEVKEVSAEGTETPAAVDEDSKSSASSEATKVVKSDDDDSDSEPDYASRPRPRIIYLKDFGGIASLGQPLLKALITAVRSRRLGLQPTEESDPTPSTDSTSTSTTTTESTPSSSSSSSSTPATPATYDSKKIQPTVILLGVSHSPESAPHNCCSSCTWTRFMEGFESSDPDKLCQLLPDILQPSLTKSNDDIAKVVADALFTTPKRTSYSERTFVDPDVGTGAIYRQIICAYGFHDSRDPFVKKKKHSSSSSSSSSKKKDGDKENSKEPDETLWRNGKAATQKERKEEFGVMRLSRNELVVRKALTSLGGGVGEGVDIFSALPPEEKEEEETDKKKAKGKGKEKEGKKDKKDKKKKKKSKEDLEAEKYSTIAGLKENLISRTVADRIAAIALHGLPTSPSTPSSAIKPATTAPSTPSTSKKSSSSERIVSPEDLAAAIKASLTGNDQRKKWLENYQRLKDAVDSNVDLDNSSDDESDSETSKKKEDPILAKVRRSGTLNSHEERLIGGVIDTTQLATGFEDVCIDPKIVDSVRMIISLPLMYPKAFASGILGAEALSGILLYGPPGTGKTMLCRAVAKECNVRMLLVAPSNVQDMYVGETEKLVKAIFTLARKIAPCVIFIDEVDAIFGSRSSDNTNGSRYHRSMVRSFSYTEAIEWIF